MRLYAIIVNRHKATVKFLQRWIENWFKSVREIHTITMEHIDDIHKLIDLIEDLRTASGNNIVIVIGNFPFEHLVKIFDYIHSGIGIGHRVGVYVVSMAVPKKLRGKDLNEEEVERYIKIYRVDALWTQQTYPRVGMRLKEEGK